MSDKETQQLTLQIIDYARKAKLTEFHFLENWTEYRFYQERRRTLKLLIKTLYKGTDRLFEKYRQSIVSDTDDFTKLLAYKQMLSTIEFYKKELAVVTDMIYEYEAYLLEGNYINAWLGEQRAVRDLHDFRDC